MIAVVVPTIRETCLQDFLFAWRDQFRKHQVIPIIVRDGDHPTVAYRNRVFDLPQIMQLEGEDYSDAIFNKTDAVRMLGMAFIARYLPNVDTIITLDDDVAPLGDTIGDHLAILGKKVPTSLMSSIQGTEHFMRGFPYGVRTEADVVVSHGVWEGVYDWDAATQIHWTYRPQPRVQFYKGPIPRGVYMPICGMNLAFARSELSEVYYAPMGHKALGLNRFADIWMGIALTDHYRNLNKAIVTGYATVHHTRASSVWKNMIQEAEGLGMNETLWTGTLQHEYIALYQHAQERWRAYIRTAEELHRMAPAACALDDDGPTHDP